MKGGAALVGHTNYGDVELKFHKAGDKQRTKNKKPAGSKRRMYTIGDGFTQLQLEASLRASKEGRNPNRMT